MVKDIPPLRRLLDARIFVLDDGKVDIFLNRFLILTENSFFFIVKTTF